jgi:hypothetical protein
VFRRGFLQLGPLGGVAVRLHWTLPLGAFALSGARVDPLLWLSVLGLISIHELGHLAVVKAVGAQPVTIDLMGYGGACRWNGSPSAIGRAAIAWGGIAAQLVLLALIQLCVAIAPDLLPARIIWVGTIASSWLIALNLLPIAPLDGAEAWHLPWQLGLAARHRLSSFRDVRHVHPEDVEMNETPKGAQAKQLANELLRAAREDEQNR